MIRKLYNTIAMQISQMLEVSDDFVREYSNGCVEEPSYDRNSASVVSEKIFDLENDSMKIGHIELASPVVNVQYLFGTRPILPKILKMTRKELESIVYMARYVGLSEGEFYKKSFSEKEKRELEEKNPEIRTVLTREEYESAATDDSNPIIFGIGPLAVEVLLQKENVKDAEYMVLHTLPVLPFCVRSVRDKNGTVSLVEINGLYSRVIMRNNRVKRMLELGAPFLINCNEIRMLQEYSDALVNNGARGKAVCVTPLYPTGSLQELFEAISALTKRKNIENTEDCSNAIDTEKLKEILKEFFTLMSNCEGISYFDPDSPDYKKHFMLAEKVYELFSGMTGQYLKNTYPEYADIYDDIHQYLIHCIDETLYQCYDENNEDFLYDTMSDKEYIANGLQKNIDLFVKKRCKWIA